MITFVRGAALIWLMVLSGCASTRVHSPGEAITLSRRPWFAVCAGVCPDYDITVQANGRGWSVRHHFDKPDEVAELRISRSGFARFRSSLAPFRLWANDPEPEDCRHDVAPEEASLIVKTREIEIKWADGDGSAHLIACQTPDNRPLVAAMDEALRSVGLYPDGHRRR